MIETEHLLLFLREDGPLLKQCVGPAGNLEAIRAEIDKQIPKKQSYSTSVEVPLSEDARRALNLAVEEADRLAHRQVGTGHRFIGLSRVRQKDP
jgi:ATP-dependent Clp protease ATP-binding subunit ClpC